MNFPSSKGNKICNYVLLFAKLLYDIYLIDVDDGES